MYCGSHCLPPSTMDNSAARGPLAIYRRWQSYMQALKFIPCLLDLFGKRGIEISCSTADVNFLFLLRQSLYAALVGLELTEICPLSAGI